MEERSRQQLLEEILKRICQVRTLNYEVLKDLLVQLKSITKSKSEEEESMLFIVRMALKELKKYKDERTDSDRAKRLRTVLSSITNDLTVHIRIWFPELNSQNSTAIIN